MTIDCTLFYSFLKSTDVLLVVLGNKVFGSQAFQFFFFLIMLWSSLSKLYLIHWNKRNLDL